MKKPEPGDIQNVTAVPVLLCAQGQSCPDSPTVQTLASYFPFAKGTALGLSARTDVVQVLEGEVDIIGRGWRVHETLVEGVVWRACLNACIT
jgi:hypothetical protein